MATGMVEELQSTLSLETKVMNVGIVAVNRMQYLSTLTILRFSNSKAPNYPRNFHIGLAL